MFFFSLSTCSGFIWISALDNRTQIKWKFCVSQKPYPFVHLSQFLPLPPLPASTRKKNLLHRKRFSLSTKNSWRGHPSDRRHEDQRAPPRGATCRVCGGGSGSSRQDRTRDRTRFCPSENRSSCFVNRRCDALRCGFSVKQHSRLENLWASSEKIAEWQLANSWANSSRWANKVRSWWLFGFLLGVNCGCFGAILGDLFDEVSKIKDGDFNCFT